MIECILPSKFSNPFASWISARERNQVMECITQGFILGMEQPGLHVKDTQISSCLWSGKEGDLLLHPQFNQLRPTGITISPLLIIVIYNVSQNHFVFFFFKIEIYVSQDTRCGIHHITLSRTCLLLLHILLRLLLSLLAQPVMHWSSERRDVMHLLSLKICTNPSCQLWQNRFFMNIYLLISIYTSEAFHGVRKYL